MWTVQHGKPLRLSVRQGSVNPSGGPTPPELSNRLLLAVYRQGQGEKRRVNMVVHKTSRKLPGQDSNLERGIQIH